MLVPAPDPEGGGGGGKRVLPPVFRSGMELVVATLLPMVLVIGGVNAGAVLARGLWKVGSCPSAPGLSGEKFRRSLGKEGSANRSWKVTPLPWWTDGWVVAD